MLMRAVTTANKMPSKLIMLIGVAIIMIGCTADKGRVRPVSVGKIIVDGKQKIPLNISYAISPKISTLSRIIKPSTFAGSAWSYPLEVGSGLDGSLTNMTKSLFRNAKKDIKRAGGIHIYYDLSAFDAEIQGTGTGAFMSTEVSIRTTVSENGNTLLSFTSSGDSQRTSSYDLAFDAGKWAGKNPIVVDLERISGKAIQEALEHIANTLSTQVKRQLHTNSSPAVKSVDHAGEQSHQASKHSISLNCSQNVELLKDQHGKEIYSSYCASGRNLIISCQWGQCRTLD